MSLDKRDRIRISTRVIGVIALVLLVWLLTRTASLSDEVIPSTEWVNVYSTNSIVDDEPLPVGASVAVFDADGAPCGAITVTKEGWYGLLACYRDDPATEEDEGAVLGQALYFTIEGEPAWAVPQSLNGSPVAPYTRVTWSGRGDRWEVDLRQPLPPVGGYSLAPGQPAPGLQQVVLVILLISLGLTLSAIATRRGQGADPQRRER